MQPGCTRSKARIFPGIPLHGRTCIVTGKCRSHFQSFLFAFSRIQGDLVLIEGADIIDFIPTGKFHILHADFLSLVDKGQTLQQKIYPCQKLFGSLAQILRADIMTNAAGFVVVFNDIGNHPHITDLPLCLENTGLVFIRSQVLSGIIPAFPAFSITRSGKIKHGGKISVIPDKILNFLFFCVKNLAHGKSLVGTEGFFLHFSQKISDSLRFLQHISDIAQSIIPVSGIIGKRQFFLNVDDCVNPKAAKTFFHPPADIFVNFLPDLGIFPVEIRLFFMKNMEILFVRMPGKRLPHRTSEIAAPVAGKGLPLFSVPDVEKVSVFSIRILHCFLKPFMLIGTMVHHKIHQNVHIPFFCFHDQPLHVLHGTKARINAVIVRNIIALICQRRFVHGGNPHNVYPQFL